MSDFTSRQNVRLPQAVRRERGPTVRRHLLVAVFGALVGAIPVGSAIAQVAGASVAISVRFDEGSAALVQEWRLAHGYDQPVGTAPGKQSPQALSTPRPAASLDSVLAAARASDLRATLGPDADVRTAM
ncbi:MAG: hypothetical protein ABI411_12520 [Tahibacter sp.]